MKSRHNYRARDQVWVYAGRNRHKATVIGDVGRDELEREIHAGVFRLQLEDGAFIDAHRRQMTPYKGPQTVFCAIFQMPVMTPSGLSIPRDTMEEALGLGDKGCKILGVVEYREVKRHRIEDIPSRPEFLKPKETT